MSEPLPADRETPPPARADRREAFTDALGLAFLLCAVVGYLRPTLLLLPTIAAGGDTQCHYPTAAWFTEHLLPEGRLHGWYPGAYLGHPVLLYYFPLPFVVMAALAPLAGLPVAFKAGSLLGVPLLPVCTYFGFRLLGFRFPGPLVGAAAAVVFLLVEENPIWGGTIASTLTGEFSYTYGTALAVLFLGLAYRAFARGGSPWGPGALLALVAFAHGYAVLWAGLSATFFLWRARRPARTLGWLAAVAAIAFALAAPWLLPLLADWRWTTPYDDPWITVSMRNVFPELLWPLFAAAVFGLAHAVAEGRRGGGADQRLLFLAHAAAVAAALAAAGPALGIIDVRFVPFAQLALALCGAAWIGALLRPLQAAPLAALGCVLLAVGWGDARSRVVRAWTDWNYTGLEAKENWPAFARVMETLRGGVADPRVAVEYGQVHEKAGSIRMYETVPHFSGRSTLEGVYNQASLSTHPVYYLTSELGASSPNPFKRREYSTFDTEGALAHLRLFNAREVVAVSTKLRDALLARGDVRHLLSDPPYDVFALAGGPARYVEPLAFAPVRSDPAGWRDKAYRWFLRKPLPGAHLVFTRDAQVGVPERDEWLAPPEAPLPPGVTVTEQVSAEEVRFTTDRPGHPLLVKISYHPRWRADGADGPYLASPSLMVVVPRQREVVLRYARAWPDVAGVVLLVGALAGLAASRWPRRAARSVPAAVIPGACEVAPPARRWGAAVPAALLAGLIAARFVAAAGDHRPGPLPLYELASRAYAEERYADAAEYARHALGRADGALEPELLCLRGESLLRTGDPARAAEAFDRVVARAPASPYVAQALFGSAQAHAARGDLETARALRERLRLEFADSPWAARVPGDP